MPHALAYRSTPQHLFWVKETAANGVALMFDRHSMSGTGPTSQTYMRQMAHFPLLLAEKPERALLICFGVGVTADAIRKHDTVSRVDVVDINPSVYELNGWFASDNGNVLADPKLRLFADDGRQYLKLTTESYDFATMEPPPPFMPGIARLYSADYYADLKRRLRPGAVVSQWLPDYQLDQRGVDLVIATFIDAFPHAFLFVGVGRELILVGSDRPFDFGRVERALAARNAVRADLARLGFTAPHQVLATILRTTDSLKAEWQDRPIIRDGFLSLEALLLGMGQAVHPRSPFWAPKPNLVLDREDVRRTLAARAPRQLEAVMALWDFPQSDSTYSKIVLENYLRRP
jgi:spermidine synthase